MLTWSSAYDFCVASSSFHPVSRRSFLTSAAGLIAGGVAFSACGGSSSSSGSTTTTGSGGTTPLPGDLAIVQRFPNSVQVPGVSRLPVSLATQSGLLDVNTEYDLPEEITVTIKNMETGDVVADDITAMRHEKGLSIPYWPVVVTIEEVGIYSMTINGVKAEGAGIQILGEKLVPIPLLGKKLPGFDTPTKSNTRGVDPICTRTDGVCPFHDVTLNEALKMNKPVVYLIGSPAHCKTGTCSPALEGLIDLRKEIGDSATVVHADVYKDTEGTVVAPAVEALGLLFEPVLFITDAMGTLIKRLDAVFDIDEIRDTLRSAGIV